MKAFEILDSWPPDNVAAAVITPDSSVHRFGDTSRVFELASVTKLLTAAAVHLSVEEGSVALTDELGVVHESDTARGATIADVLAHAGGFGPNGAVLDDPGRKRIYSNGGYELLGAAVSRASDMAFEQYMQLGIFDALNMGSSELVGSAAYAGRSTVDDLISFVQGLAHVLAPETFEAMVSQSYPELTGVLPGYGRQAPNPWGLGPEIRGEKSPHWTGTTNSEATWGHFGQTGTFLWVDPQVQVALILLTDKPFGPWALPLWPAFSDAVRQEVLEG